MLGRRKLHTDESFLNHLTALHCSAAILPKSTIGHLFFCQPVWAHSTQVCAYLLYMHLLHVSVRGGRRTKIQKRVKEKG